MCYVSYYILLLLFAGWLVSQIFVLSAFSLACIRFQPWSDIEHALSREKKNDPCYMKRFFSFLLGIRFLFQNHVLRSIAILFMLFSLVTAAGINLFFFHLKNDLH